MFNCKQKCPAGPNTSAQDFQEARSDSCTDEHNAYRNALAVDVVQRKAKKSKSTRKKAATPKPPPPPPPGLKPKARRALRLQ